MPTRGPGAQRPGTISFHTPLLQAHGVRGPEGHDPPESSRFVTWSPLPTPRAKQKRSAQSRSPQEGKRVWGMRFTWGNEVSKPRNRRARPQSAGLPHAGQSSPFPAPGWTASAGLGSGRQGERQEPSAPCPVSRTSSPHGNSHLLPNGALNVLKRHASPVTWQRTSRCTDTKSNSGPQTGNAPGSAAALSATADRTRSKAPHTPRSRVRVTHPSEEP